MGLIKKMKKNKKGFTLVELIVVLVILAILAAIAVPTFMGYITRAKNQQADTEKRTVLLAAQTAVSTETEQAAPSDTHALAYAKELSGIENITALTSGTDGVKTVTFTASNGKAYTWTATDTAKGGSEGTWAEATTTPPAGGGGN